MRLQAAPNWINGSQINIFGKDASDNGIQMFAVKDYNTNSYSVLALTPNGSLFLQPPGTQVANSLSGAAIVAMSITANGYIKYASGLILQWGESNWIADGISSREITFPLTLAFPRSVVTGAVSGSGNFYVVMRNINTTGFIGEGVGSFPDGSNSSFKWMSIHL